MRRFRVTSPTGLACPRVLVIEDEPDVNALLLTYLSRQGCEVATASTGEEGLALAQADPPDVVFVDLLLPGVDGREVARRLRTQRRTASCRIVIASILDAEEHQGIGDAVLSKPFTRRDVARVLAEVGAGSS